MLKLDITNDAAKFLKKLPPKQFKQVTSAIFALMKDPEPHDSIQMKGYAEYRRVDIGEYRVVYRYTSPFAHFILGKINYGQGLKKLKIIVI